MFCNQCGAKLEKAASFCSSCGHRVSLDEGQGGVSSGSAVTLLFQQIRVTYGEQTMESMLAFGDEPYVFPKDSEYVRTANAPFNPSVVPSPGDLVPLNSAWAVFKHPGNFPRDPNSVGSIDKKFVAMGPLPGRTFDEIVAVVGLPMTDMANAEGRVCVFGKTGLFSIWQIGLRFDTYGICMSIFSQTNI